MKKYLIFVLSMAPAIAFGAYGYDYGGKGNTFGGVVDSIVSYINQIVLLITAASLLVFFWGLAQFILKSGDSKEHAKGRSLMMWGVIIFFVMGSLWGIINLFAYSIFRL